MDIQQKKYNLIKEKLIADQDLQSYITKKGVDILPFVDDQVFFQNFQFMDPAKDKQVDDLRQEMRKYMFFTGFGMGPFIYFAKEKKNKLFLLPTIAVFIAGKYFMDTKLDHKLRQNNLNDYYIKQGQLNRYLKYLDIEISNFDKLKSINKLYDKK